MKDILTKAEELGKAIAESERFKAVQADRNEVEADKTLQADLDALEKLSQKTAQLEKEVKPVEPEDKRRLRELQQKVAGDQNLQKLARAEADFAELMNRVNKTVRGQFFQESQQNK